MDYQDDYELEEGDDGHTFVSGGLRTAKACDACHKSKARCGGDGTVPCSACVRKGIACVYSAAKKRGPKSGALRALQDEIEMLRDQVRSLSSASSSGAKAKPSDDGVSKPPPHKRPRRSDPVFTPLPYAMFIPVQSEPRIAALEMEVRFIRLYFLYCNALLPMVCKTSFYHAGLRLGILDMVNVLCEETIPLCDHKNGDCAGMTFISFDLARELLGSAGVVDVPRLVAAARAAGKASGTGTGTLAKALEAASVLNGTRPRRPVTMSAQQLAAAHMAQLPDHLRDAGASAPKQMSAAKACYYGVLAVGARMDMQPDRADAYIARCREALSLAWDEPCLETISACMLLGYYTCGCAASGDMLRSKCYISLANEMADGLDTSAAANRRRAYQNAFSADIPEASSTVSPGEKAAQARAPSILHPVQDAMERNSNMQARSLGPDGHTMPSVTGAALSEAGLPLDIVLSVRFLAQLTSAYRSASGTVHYRGDEWDSPRGKVSRILAYVTQKTRRRVSTPADLQRIAPALLNALSEAETIVVANKCGGSMDFATLATVETSRAVVYQACGDNAMAFEYVKQALALMDNEFRRLTNYFVMGIFVQLIPVCLSAGHPECVNVVMRYLTDLEAMWPVGHVLVTKAHRRIMYCTLGPSRGMSSNEENAESSTTGSKIEPRDHPLETSSSFTAISAITAPASESRATSMRESGTLTPLDHLAAVTETFAEPVQDGDGDGDGEDAMQQRVGWPTATSRPTSASALARMNFTMTPAGFSATFANPSVVAGSSEESRNLSQYPSAHGVVVSQGARPTVSMTAQDHLRNGNGFASSPALGPMSPAAVYANHSFNLASMAERMSDHSAFDFLMDDFDLGMPIASPMADYDFMATGLPGSTFTEPRISAEASGSALTPALSQSQETPASSFVPTPATVCSSTSSVQSSTAAGPGSNVMMGRGGIPLRQTKLL